MSENGDPTNEPLASGDQAKIFVFSLLLVPTIFTFVGILPAIFIGFGIVLLKKNKDFSAVETSVKLVFGYLWIFLVVISAIALYNLGADGAEPASTSYAARAPRPNRDENVFVALVLLAINVAYMIFVKALYLSPLRKHREWVANNGIFSKTSRSSRRGGSGSDMKIIKGENMRSYSVADELSKWAKLRDEGVVSEQEFKEARNKILQSQ